MKALAIEGWMTPAELGWIAAKAHQANLIIEVGSWKGRSTAAWAEYTRGVVVAVDHFGGDKARSGQYQESFEKGSSEIKRQFLLNTDTFNNILLVETDSVKAAGLLDRLFHGGVDVVFIDGDHSHEGAYEDIMLWSLLLRSGGLLCGHDQFEVQSSLKKALPAWESGPDSIWWWRAP